MPRSGPKVNSIPASRERKEGTSSPLQPHANTSTSQPRQFSRVERSLFVALPLVPTIPSDNGPNLFTPSSRLSLSLPLLLSHSYSNPNSLSLTSQLGRAVLTFTFLARARAKRITPVSTAANVSTPTVHHSRRPARRLVEDIAAPASIHLPVRQHHHSISFSSSSRVGTSRDL